jgi:hypothetical protein
VAALLDRIEAEIRDRLRAGEAAVREYERLEAALAALEAVEPPPEARPRASASSQIVGGGPASLRRIPAARPRAPRGANRAAVLRVLGDRPGVSVAELSSASGVARPVLYSLLKTLEQRGEIAKEQLPGGSTGYRLAPEVPAEPASDAPHSPEPS